MAEQVAQIAAMMHWERTGHAPASISVVLSNQTLVITLRGALTEAETALVASQIGAARVQKFHRELFVTSAELMRQEIKRITGVAVRGATAEIETNPALGDISAAGTMVQVFLLDESVPVNSWSGA